MYKKGGLGWTKRWTVKYGALTQLKAKHLEKGKFADGQGLWLWKSRKETGKWVLRLTLHGRRREMGLGPWPEVSIAEARTRASDARKQVRDGFDPIVERDKLKKKAKKLTVAEAIESCFQARQAELKGDGKTGRWLSPLKTHVIPKLGKYPIEEITQHELKNLFDPIWHTKPDAARKALNRMNLTLKHAAALGLTVDLQAVMKTKALLGKQRHEVTHIPSLPYHEMPEFYAWLSRQELISALALRFLILTLARTSEVRFATYDEIDGDIWTLPPERTKNGQEHRIPLVDEALAVMKLARKDQHQKLLFPSANGKPLSDAAMARFLDREGYSARPHGFRATFRTWVEEQTDTPFEVKESALGHSVDAGVVGAYQRSDRLQKRELLLREWVGYLKTLKI